MKKGGMHDYNPRLMLDRFAIWRVEEVELPGTVQASAIRYSQFTIRVK